MRKPLLAAAMLAIATPAFAVGLGPLRKDGVTDGPVKGFYLTLFNPYEARDSFIVYAVGADDEAPVPAARVKLPAAPISLPTKGQKRLLVMAQGLAPGESYTFRVCAERYTTQEESIHARACSRLTARRLPVRG